jgi:hypothetical protein
MRRAEVMTGFNGEATFDGLTEAFFEGWGETVSNPEQETQILEKIKQDFDDGALALGFPPAYGSGAGTQESIKLWKMAAANNVPVSVHVRYQSMLDPNSSVTAMNEMLGLAASIGRTRHSLPHPTARTQRSLHDARRHRRWSQGRAQAHY